MARRGRHRRSKRHHRHRNADNESQIQTQIKHQLDEISESNETTSTVNSSTSTLTPNKCDVYVQTQNLVNPEGRWPPVSSVAARLLAIMASIRFRKYDGDVTSVPGDKMAEIVIDNDRVEVQSRNTSQASLNLDFTLNSSDNSIISIAQRDALIRSECSLKRLFKNVKERPNLSTNSIPSKRSSLVIRNCPNRGSISKPLKFVRYIGVNRTRTVKTKNRFDRRTKQTRKAQKEVKSFSPRRLTLERSSNSLRMSICHIQLQGLHSSDTWPASPRWGIGIFAEVRKIHQKFISKVIKHFKTVCSWLGLDIEAGSLKLRRYFLQGQASFGLKAIEYSPSTIKGCDHFDEIEKLKQEISLLKEELYMCKTCAKEVNDLKLEVDDLKKQIKQMGTALLTSNGCRQSSCEPPAPPPPPPPPLPSNLHSGKPGGPPAPPPPPLPKFEPSTPKLVIQRSSNKNNAAKEEVGNTRPVISVDAILNVKLRKLGDRKSPVKMPSHPGPAPNRNSQPMVSMDMLRQVKLKPAPRNSAGGCGRASGRGITSSESSLPREVPN